MSQVEHESKFNTEQLRGITLKQKFWRCPTPRHLFHLQVQICCCFDLTQRQPICNILWGKPHPGIPSSPNIHFRVRRTKGLVFISLDMSNISHMEDGKWYSAPIVLSREMLRKEPSRFKRNRQWFFWGKPPSALSLYVGCCAGKHVRGRR